MKVFEPNPPDFEMISFTTKFPLNSRLNGDNHTSASAMLRLHTEVQYYCYSANAKDRAQRKKTKSSCYEEEQSPHCKDDKRVIVPEITVRNSNSL